MKPEIRKPTKKELEDAESWPTWQKGESSFPWNYDQKETCLILEGKAVVKTAEGNVEFGVGDYVIFPEGLSCTWEIKERIKKRYEFG